MTSRCELDASEHPENGFERRSFAGCFTDPDMDPEFLDQLYRSLLDRGVIGTDGGFVYDGESWQRIEISLGTTDSAEVPDFNFQFMSDVTLFPDASDKFVEAFGDYKPLQTPLGTEPETGVETLEPGEDDEPEDDEAEEPEGIWRDLGLPRNFDRRPGWRDIQENNGGSCSYE